MTASGRHAAPAGPALRGSPTPRRSAAATPIGILTALILVALGVVAVRDALVAAGTMSGRSWVASAADTLDGLTPSGWMLPVGVLAALVGLVLVGAALKPRRPAAVRVSAETPVWIAPGALARIATEAARAVPGVNDAHTKAGTRRLRIRATVLQADTTGPADRVRAQVAERLSGLASPPGITVKATSQGSQS